MVEVNTRVTTVVDATMRRLSHTYSIGSRWSWRSCFVLSSLCLVGGMVVTAQWSAFKTG